MRHCTNCGAQLNQTEGFCVNCGAKIENIEESENNINQTNSTTVSSNDEPSIINSTEAINNNLNNIPMNNSANNNFDNNNNNNNLNTNMTNNNPENNKPQGNNNGIKMAIIGAVCGVAGAAVVFFIILIIIGSSISNDVTSDEPNNTGSNGSGDASTVGTVTYKQYLEGFQLNIPAEIYSYVESDTLFIYDTDDTWAASVIVGPVSYSKMVAQQKSLTIIFNSDGTTAKNVKEEKYNGKGFLTVEISSSNYNYLFAYTEANSANVFGISLQTIDNDYGYDELNELSTILSSATYVGTTTNMKTDNFKDLKVKEKLKELK